MQGCRRHAPASPVCRDVGCSFPVQMAAAGGTEAAGPLEAPGPSQAQRTPAHARFRLVNLWTWYGDYRAFRTALPARSAQLLTCRAAGRICSDPSTISTPRSSSSHWSASRSSLGTGCLFAGTVIPLSQWPSFFDTSKALCMAGGRRRRGPVMGVSFVQTSTSAAHAHRSNECFFDLTSRRSMLLKADDRSRS